MSNVFEIPFKHGSPFGFIRNPLGELSSSIETEILGLLLTTLVEAISRLYIFKGSALFSVLPYIVAVWGVFFCIDETTWLKVCPFQGIYGFSLKFNVADIYI
jgi:hypothetical protein